MKNENYDIYNGRIAEALAEAFLRRNGYIVIRNGVEEFLGGVVKYLEPTEKEQIYKLYTQPDFMCIKTDKNNKITGVYNIEVKQRYYKTYNEFEKSFKRNGEMYKEAEKYSKNHEDVFLMCFITHPNSKDKNTLVHEIYYGSANKVIDFNSGENKDSLWLDKLMGTHFNKEECQILKEKMSVVFSDMGQQ